MKSKSRAWKVAFTTVVLLVVCTIGALYVVDAKRKAFYENDALAAIRELRQALPADPQFVRYTENFQADFQEVERLYGPIIEVLQVTAMSPLFVRPVQIKLLVRRTSGIYTEGMMLGPTDEWLNYRVTGGPI